MMNWNDLRVEQEIAQERYQRLIRDREIDRLIGQTRPAEPPLWRLLAGLGKHLERWGQKLQTYGSLRRPDAVGCR